MAKTNFAEMVKEICLDDVRYSLDGYLFVREGLDHTLKSLKRAGHGSEAHVTGHELLEGIRDYALKEFGPMSKSVLNEWGINTCEDIGNIVFNLVNKGVLGRRDSDSPADFQGGFSFDEAFVEPFKPRPEGVTGNSQRSSRKAKRPSSKNGSTQSA